MSFVKEEDRYTENEVCVICQRCEKFRTRGCAGASALIYYSRETCVNFVQRVDANNELYLRAKE